jgi:hypothetical protein
VERAFTLWATGQITLESLEDEKQNKKGKGPITGVLKTLNKRSGKLSTKPNAFSDPNWGSACRKYLITINENLRPASLTKILDLAQEHLKPPRRGTSTTTATGLVEENMHVDERALLIDVSDDETCQPSHSSLQVCHYSLLYRILRRTLAFKLGCGSFTFHSFVIAARLVYRFFCLHQSIVCGPFSLPN